LQNSPTLVARSRADHDTGQSLSLLSRNLWSLGHDFLPCS
jgi:hypothetical protein